jgi:hypothetical protein
MQCEEEDAREAGRDNRIPESSHTSTSIDRADGV